MKTRHFFLVHCGLVLGLMLAVHTARADVIHLKNGNKIFGDVVENQNKDAKHVVVKIGTSGHVTLRASEVAKVEKEEAEKAAVKAPAASGDYHAVTLKTGGSFYGDGVYYGIVSSESDDQTLVLVIPDAGKIRIPKAAVDSMVKVELPPKSATPEKADESSIETTHVLHLKNGRSISGNIMKTGDDEPIRVLIGQLGVLEIPRSQVERVEEKKGSIKLPEPPPVKPEPKEEAVLRQVPPEFIEKMKKEIRAELLREMIDGAIEEKIDDAIGRKRLLESAFQSEILEDLTNDRILELQDMARELTRQRNTNRVRAERNLARAGSAAIPFVKAAAHHPFDLTRRAVQRIVREVGDMRGIPIAIEGLTDRDKFVRQLAHDALKDLLPGIDMKYNPQASEKRRIEAADSYWDLWGEILFREARFSLLERLASG